MKIPTNSLEPCFDPSYLTKFLLIFRAKKISPRMVSHVVQTTIGEAAAPADGRGRKRMFSLRDIALIIMGIDLLDLGLPPARVRVCIEAVKDAWSELFPHDFIEQCKSETSKPKKTENKYLVAGHYPEERETRSITEPLAHSFQVEFCTEKMLRRLVGRYVRSPQIVYWVDQGLSMIMAEAFGAVIAKSDD